jgi:two-component system alkaline phosphatase synthesis response regulator PhoP
MVGMQSAPVAGEPLPRSAVSTPSLGPNNTILLAEDDGPLRGILSYVLQMEGFNVVTADDGFEALSIARRERPLVAILDVVMPRMGGDDVCCALRSDGDLHSTFVVLISALPARQAEQIAREADADLFLRKPIDHDLLLEIISSVFEHRSGRTACRASTAS